MHDSQDSQDSPVASEAIAHCPFWCEENIWHLCGHSALAGAELRQVLIVSNLQGRFAMWAQRAAPHPSLPLAWDYHVVALARAARQWQIWDLDSTLGAPTPANHWLDSSFLPLRPSAQAWAPSFRVVSAADYRREFSSDRSHMLDEAGEYREPPPAWPAILRGPANLRRFLDFGDAFLGEILSLAELRAWLAGC